jgi:hypothetical protein
MKRFLHMSIVLLFLAGILPFSLVNPLPHGSAAEKASAKKIDALIADLGSDLFETREAATQALKERLEALPELRKARRSADREVRLRVEAILTVLEPKCCFRKAQALAKAGRAVEVADRLALSATRGIAAEEGWDSLMRFTDQLIKSTERYFPLHTGHKLRRGPDFPAGEFRQFAKLYNPREIAERKIDLVSSPKDKRKAWDDLIHASKGKLLLRAEEISGGDVIGIMRGMIAASGDVQIEQANGSVIVAGGDVKLGVALCSIIICDGDVELSSPSKVTGPIVARGKVICKVGKLGYCVARSGHTLHWRDGKTIDLNDGTPDPFAFVKFFELADVGLAADDDPLREKSTAEGVRLKEVRKTSPFASGLRCGDVVTAIEDKKTPTTEIFRRVLRRKLAEEEPSVLPQSK